MSKKKSDGTQVSTVSKAKTAKAKPVDPAALKKLEEMEVQIQAGISKYFETGILLQLIRDKKLYEHRGYHSYSDNRNSIVAVDVPQAGVRIFMPSYLM